MTAPKILAFAGSARRESLNRKLVAVAAEHAREAGAEVTVIDLGDYPLPIYNQDVEDEGFPENVPKLKQLFHRHDGLLLACPEYNSSMTPLFKNTVDWVSRRTGDEKPLACFDGKVAALLAASPGRLGGLRGLVPVRMMLSNIRVLVLPQQLAVPRARQVFDDEARLVDEDVDRSVRGVVEELVHALRRLAG